VDLFVVTLQRRQIVDRRDTREVTRVNDAHVQVTDGGAPHGLVEERIAAVPDGHFQGAFGHVIVQRGAWHAQEERQLAPVFQHVRDGVAQRGIRLDQPLVELRPQPELQFVHDGTAVFLMQPQALLGRKPLLLGLAVDRVDVFQAFQDVFDLRRKILDHIDEVAPPVRLISSTR